MAVESDLQRYAEELQVEVEVEAEALGVEALLPEVFCGRVIERLAEIGEIEEAFARSHHERGIQVAGYGIEDGETLNLLTVDYDHATLAGRIGNQDISALFRRLRRFWDECRDRPYHKQLEESSDAWDMAIDIHERAAQIKRVRLYVFTNSLARVEYVEPQTDHGVEYRFEVWDLARLWRLEREGARAEPIEIDFVRDFGAPLPVLAAPDFGADYQAYVTVFPGEVLAHIYAIYGSRLLERNVRSFLQFTGKINRGIRETLRTAPERFLAYNNGISATASSLELVELPDGSRGIRRLHDLQIVNGGQTTVSISRAAEMRVDLTKVMVQAKITEVDSDLLEELVPKISEYANSQNRVSIADLSSNQPFHIAVEALARSVWAPSTGESGQTQWFYERARGQYSDAMHRHGTPARIREFKRRTPAAQRISKTDLAKYENTWALLPYEVSKGAQKNFTAFMTRLKERPIHPDVAWWQRLVAKAILWKATERLVSREQFGGYRANLVAYSLAKLVHETQQRLDLGGVWERQSIPPELAEPLRELAHLAFGVLTASDRKAQNVTEWAKREECWRRMKDSTWLLPPAASDLLVPTGRAAARARDSAAVEPALAPSVMSGGLPEDHPDVQAVVSIGGDAWFAIANWAKQTNNLSAWDRQFSFSLGRRIKQGKAPTDKQLPHAKRILDEVRTLGYAPLPTSDADGM
jgi:hypothetical protein